MVVDGKQTLNAYLYRDTLLANSTAFVERERIWRDSKMPLLGARAKSNGGVLGAGTFLSSLLDKFHVVGTSPYPLSVHHRLLT